LRPGPGGLPGVKQRYRVLVFHGPPCNIGV